MWGRKDKKEKRGERRKGGGSKGGAGLPFMGLGVPPGECYSPDSSSDGGSGVSIASVLRICRCRGVRGGVGG